MFIVVSSVKFIEHIVGKQRVTLDPEKVRGIHDTSQETRQT